MHTGLKVPVYCRRVFLGDDLKLSIPAKLLQSQPTISPVMGSFKLRIEWYYQSDTNLYGWLDNNDKQSTETILNLHKHRVEVNTSTYGLDRQYDVYDQQSSESVVEMFREGYVGIGRGSIWDFLGVPACYVRPDIQDQTSLVQFGNVWNLDTALMYLNIARSYWTNPQWPNLPYVSGAYLSTEGPIGPLSRTSPFDTVNLTDLDNLFKWLRTKDDGIFVQDIATIPSLTPGQQGYITDEVAYEQKYKKAYRALVEWLQATMYGGPSAGLFCCQYEPDLYRNLLNDEVGSIKSTINTETGTMTIEELRFANHLQLVIDRLDISGGRFSDWARTRWGVKTRKNLDRPQLLGVTTEYIDTGLITSRENSVGEDGASAPGQLHGNINTRPGKPGFVRVRCSEPGYIMAVASVVPEVDYCQNIQRYLLDLRFEDEFSPQYVRRGFETVPRSDYSALVESEYAYIDTGDDVFNGIVQKYPNMAQSVGKQVAWLREMTDTNRVHGEFSNFGKFETWVLKRQYQKWLIYDDHLLPGMHISDFTFSPYVNPLEWQYPFVGQNSNDPNFYLQLAIKVDAVRPIGRRYMPSLE